MSCVVDLQNRREMGKSMNKTAEELQRLQRKREAEAAKREKEAFAAERERLRAEIAKDKVHRRALGGRGWMVGRAGGGRFDWDIWWGVCADVVSGSVCGVSGGKSGALGLPAGEARCRGLRPFGHSGACASSHFSCTAWRLY
jgi:hypothetical protein